MARPKSTVELIPSAKRLIRSLRDVGYDFRHAVADLVDNSIASGATIVAITMSFDGQDSWLRIADNGRGMNGPTITEAMRYGSEREYEADELGKFGLGLKTASLSQCSRLTVASRLDKTARRIESRQWDLAHIEKTNRWEIIDIAAQDRRSELVDPLKTSTGTVVLWELLDRVLGYKIPWGDKAKLGFLKLAEDLDLHLGMVFHRFLSGEARRKKKLHITINDTVVEAWDPFARGERATEALPKREFEVHGDDGTGIVSFAPFILPSQNSFSSLKAFNRHAGPGKWNYQQGFYIYRADRMIQSGGWSYMRTSDEHTKLARVALDFWPDLDSAFDLNVAKARVNLPSELKGQLQPHVEQLAKRARSVYSSTREQANSSSELPLPVGATPNAGSLTSNTMRRSGSTSVATTSHAQIDKPSNAIRKSIGEVLAEAAETTGEARALAKIRTIIESDFPHTAKEIGW